MNDIIENLLLISIQASVLILAVLALRLFINKTHKRFTYFMWMLVLIRLCLPIQIGSPIGMFKLDMGKVAVESLAKDDMSDISNDDVVGNIPRPNNSQTDNNINNQINNNVNNQQNDNLGNNISNGVVDSTVDNKFDNVTNSDALNNTIPNTDKDNVTDNIVNNDSVNNDIVNNDIVNSDIVKDNDSDLNTSKVSKERFDVSAKHVIVAVWIAGMIIVTIVVTIQLFKLKRRLKYAINVEGNVWETDATNTALVLGAFRTKIFIPTNISLTEREHILSHERMHIKHGDHIVRVVMLLANIVYWWNPLVWVATHFMKKDMEMLCDESVIKGMESEKRGEYLTALLNCSAKNSGILPVMLFGESNTENRIKHIINLKEPKLYIMIVLAMFVVVCASCCTQSNKVDTSENVTENEETDNTDDESTIKDDNGINTEPLGNQNNNGNTNVSLNSTMSNKNENLPFECGKYAAVDIDNPRYMEINKYYLIMWDTTKFWEGQTVGLEGIYYYKYFYYDVKDGVINVYTDINKDNIAFQMNVVDEFTIEFEGEKFINYEEKYQEEGSSSEESIPTTDDDELIKLGIYLPKYDGGTHYLQIYEHEIRIINTKGYNAGEEIDYYLSNSGYKYYSCYYYFTSNSDGKTIEYEDGKGNTVGEILVINDYTILYNGRIYIHKDYSEQNTTSTISKTGYKQYDELIEKMVAIHNGNEETRFDAFEQLELSYLWGYEETFDNGGFYLIDLDGDGIEEMLLGENGSGAWGGTIYGIYSIRDGELVRLCTGWDRNRYYLCEGNIIWNEGTSGAAYSSDAYYTYENGQWKLNISVCMWSFYYEEEGIKYFATHEENVDCVEYGVSITEEEYEEILAIGKDKHIPIEFTLFETISYE